MPVASALPPPFCLPRATGIMTMPFRCFTHLFRRFYAVTGVSVRRQNALTMIFPVTAIRRGA
jgi:hypothetical protein